MKRMRFVLIPVMLAGLAISGCRVEQVREGEPPEVDVEPGTAPEYDIEPGRVEVREDTHVVTVPEVDVVPIDSPSARR